ncbi:MAG: MATE family efflux transporter [Lachnospiraceae bacterium]|nr:MATE family efflux transporter [Lachnospiraceae bacterium]
MTDTVKNKALFETVSVPAAVSKMAIPTIIGQLIVLIYNLADTFFIGRTANHFMVAGASLILPVFNIALSIASVAGVGGGALLSRLLGEKRTDEAKKVYSFSIRMSLIAAASFSLLVFLFMEPLLSFLGADADTVGFARSYAFWVIVAGALPTVMTNVFSNFVRSIGESVTAGIGVFLGGAVNIALDPLFMFVLLPEGKEIVGAGIATFLSNCISCVYFLVVLGRLGRSSSLKMVPFGERPEAASVKKILSVGIPSAVATLLFDIDYIVIDKLMSGYDSIALAAVGIVLKAERLPLNIGVGICQGMVPIVAYNYASGNRERMKAVSRFSLLLGIVCAVISIALYELFAPSILRFFIDDAETVAIGTRFLRIRCLATVFMFMSFYHVHLFNGYGRGKEALFLGVTRWAVFNIPMLFLLNRIFGMYGIVWSQLAADILTVLLSFAVHRRFLRREGI